VLLQREGVAAFCVLTEPFRDQISRVMAYHTSDRPLPAVVLAHPTQNVPPEVLRERAASLADAAEKLLRGEEPEG
jgi:hypothetical protein